MKAVIHSQYGPPEELKIQEVPLPTPADNEILIKVHATSVTSSDCNMRNLTFVPSPFNLLVKMQFGFRKPKVKIQGIDFSGVVEITGKNVTKFKPGDQVFGASEPELGAYAEYLCISQDKAIFSKPTNMTHEQAAILPAAGATALYFLNDLANIRSGQSILINGASGAVGSYAVQLAKHYGAKVTGVCSTKNLDLVRSLGADKVIDYTKEDFTENLDAYDVIFDVVSKSTFSNCKPALKENGIYLYTVPTIKIILQMLWTSLIGGKKAKMSSSDVRISDLEQLKELVESGSITPVISKSFSMEEIAEAFRHVESGHKVGNVAIKIV